MDSTTWTAISSIATVLLLFVTAAYVVLTYKILKSGNTSTREQLRPYVMVSLESKNTLLYLKIENHGVRPAYNVDAKFTPPLDPKLVDKKFIDTPRILQQTVLLPKQSFKGVIAYNSDVMKNTSGEKLQKEYQLFIIYYDSEKSYYSESYKINLNDFYIQKKTAEHTVDFLMERISNDIRKIFGVLKDKL